MFVSVVGLSVTFYVNSGIYEHTETRCPWDVWRFVDAVSSLCAWLKKWRNGENPHSAAQFAE